MTKGSVAPCHSGSSKSGAGARAISIRGGRVWPAAGTAPIAIANPQNKTRVFERLICFPKSPSVEECRGGTGVPPVKSRARCARHIQTAPLLRFLKLARIVNCDIRKIITKRSQIQLSIWRDEVRTESSSDRVPSTVNIEMGELTRSLPLSILTSSVCFFMDTEGAK